MSMNGVDYTKQLAKDREYFQDANKKLRDATEKRIEDTEKRTEHVTTKQRENFIEDKAELETTYQKNLEGLKEKTRSSLANNSSKFHEDALKEREAFTQDSLKKSRDFDQRLNDIKSSYGKAFDSERDRNEGLNKSQKTKYQKNVGELISNSDKKLGEYQERLNKSGSNLKEQYSSERQQLVRAQEDRLTGAYKEAANKRAELKDRINTDSKKSKEIQANELENHKKYSNDRLSMLQEKYQDRFDTMSQDYSQRNDNLVESQRKLAIKANRESQEKLSDATRGYNDDLRQIELEKRRRDNGNGEFSEVVSKQQGHKDDVIINNKLDHVKDQLVDAQRDYQLRAGKEQVSFNDTLKEQALVGTAQLDRKLNEANANKIVSVSHEREKAEKEIANRDHQKNLEKSAYETQLMNERKNASLRINKLKETFGASMKTLEEKQKISVDDVTATSNKDKAQFIKDAQERRSEEIFAMKRSFGKLMDATVQDYEARLATYQRDNEYLKVNMGQKIQNIMDQTEKQLETQRTIFEDRRTADVKGQQLLMDQREAQLKKNFTQMNLMYQKKIDKMQIENDSKLKLITNDYESKLKELKAMTSKELASKDTNHQIELDRIKTAYEDEKVRVVSAYEGQIESMKQGHKDAMDSMQDYKKLS